MALRTIVLLAVTLFTSGSPAVPGPLHDAIKDGDLAILEELINSGEDLNAQDNFVGTPLHWVALKNDTDAARLLIAAGADVNQSRTGDVEAAHKQGRTPLMNAASASAIGVIDLLVAAGANVDAKRGDGLTALHIAVHSDSIDAVRRLVELGIDVNGEPEIEPVAFATPLAEAIYRGKTGKMEPEIAKEITAILQEAGASE